VISENGDWRRNPAIIDFSIVADETPCCHILENDHGGGCTIDFGLAAKVGQVAGPQQPWERGFPESQRSQVGAR
jgi:hypothetical protein